MLLRSSTVLMYWLSSSSSRCWSWRDFRYSAGTACLQWQPCYPHPAQGHSVPILEGQAPPPEVGEGSWEQWGQSLPFCGELLATPDGQINGWTGGQLDRWVSERMN